MIAVTLDIDWSPDPIVDAVVDLFDRYRIPLTLFCTNPDTDRSGKSSPLRGRYHPRHELALHPSFASPTDCVATFAALLKYYPEAKGFRPHNGTRSWRISEAAADLGLRYEADSTVFPVNVPGFRPDETRRYYLFVARFMDARMLHAPEFNWSITGCGLADGRTGNDALHIMVFHPNIIYYDMATADDYRERHGGYHQVSERDSFLHKQPRAAAKLVREICETIDADDCITISGYAGRRELW